MTKSQIAFGLAIRDTVTLSTESSCSMLAGGAPARRRAAFSRAQPRRTPAAAQADDEGGTSVPEL